MLLVSDRTAPPVHLSIAMCSAPLTQKSAREVLPRKTPLDRLPGPRYDRVRQRNISPEPSVQDRSRVDLSTPLGGLRG